MAHRICFTSLPNDHAPGETVPTSSAYFETYFLPSVGPTGVALMRHLHGALVHHGPADYVTTIEQLAASLGVKPKLLIRTFARLRYFGLLANQQDGLIGVRLVVTQLTRDQVAGLPDRLRFTHQEVFSRV